MERSTQAYFEDIDGYVDECLQRELLEKIPETSDITTSPTQGIDSTPENVLQKIPNSSTPANGSTHENGAKNK